MVTGSRICSTFKKRKKKIKEAITNELTVFNHFNESKNTSNEILPINSPITVKFAGGTAINMTAIKKNSKQINTIFFPMKLTLTIV